MSAPSAAAAAEREVTAAAVLRAVGVAQLDTTDAHAAPWEPIVPLTAKRILPPFPVELLPSWIATMVNEVTEALQVPADLPGCLALAALAVAAGGRVDVEPLPGWVEPTNIYTVIALAPGARKSPTYAAMTKPLYAAEKALVEATAPARYEAGMLARRARTQADKAAKAAENAESNPDAALAEAIAAAANADAHAEQAPPRLLADDVTPEKAASLIAEHGGRLALLSAEGGAFATVTGTRYSAAPNLEPLLKAHAGDTMQADRHSRGPESVERPALTIGITTQPQNLAEIAANPAARDRGLLARFLYSVPVNTVGHRKIHPAPVTAATKTAYGDKLTQLVLDLAALPERVALPFTPDAVDLLGELEAWLEPRLDPEGGALAAVTDWASKMAGAALRLAGLIHLAHHGTTGLQHPLTAPTMAGGIALARYYLAHALAVFDHIGATPEHEGARRILAWIDTTKPATFTKRDLLRARASRQFRTAADLDPALSLLLDHGHLRHAPKTPGTSGGRPSTTYQVHPELL